MFIWGWNTKSIGNTVTNLECSHCQYPNIVIAAFQKFFDVFFIPTIPLTKDHILICPNCETQFSMGGYGIDLDSIPKVKTPWWGYVGLFILALGISGIVILSMFVEPRNKNINVENLMANDVVVLKDKDNADFPYALLKITQVDNGELVFVHGKYGYSSAYQAGKAARKNRENNFYEDTYEASVDEFKKLEIMDIEKFN